MVFVPGAGHGGGSPITTRKRNDFFMKHLRGVTPPNWNDLPPNVTAGNGDGDEIDYAALEAELFPQVRIVR
jgi:hypothetical protein